jgi:magnesium-transporting ATPase (P-type)
MALQFANAIVGFVEEFNAGNAIDALKQQLAPQANVIRGGVHSKIAARELVPGDLIEIKLGASLPLAGAAAASRVLAGAVGRADQKPQVLRVLRNTGLLLFAPDPLAYVSLARCHISAVPAAFPLPFFSLAGDVIPADAILLEGRPVQVDQAALTGESLPATAGPGSLVMMSSALKQGHIRAIIVDTGKNTFIGRAAGMMASVQHQSNLHRILLQITIVLLIICIIACACIFARLMTSPDPPYAVWDGAGDSKFLRSLSVVVVILVASIPVAIEVVVTSTMAVGSHVMASKKVRRRLMACCWVLP